MAPSEKSKESAADCSKLLLAKADWERINRDIQELLPPVPRECLTNTDFDNQVEKFTVTVSTAVNTHTPRAKPSPYVKRWWTDDLTLLRRSYSSIRNSVTTARRRGLNTSEIIPQVLTVRRLFFTEVEKQKKAHWKDFLQDPANIWKANQYTRNTNASFQIPELNEGDRTVQSDEGKAELLLRTFFPPPPQPTSSEHKKLPRRIKDRPPSKLPPFTKEEVRLAFHLPNPKKAPGLDGLSFEV